VRELGFAITPNLLGPCRLGRRTLARQATEQRKAPHQPGHVTLVFHWHSPHIDQYLDHSLTRPGKLLERLPQNRPKHPIPIGTQHGVSPG
jgi:hypothetical protein